MVDLDINTTTSRQTRRQAKMAAMQCATSVRQPKVKTGRRVVRMVDSSSEEEQVERMCMQSTGRKARVRGTWIGIFHTLLRFFLLML